LKVLHAKAGKAVNVITDQILEENKTRFLWLTLLLAYHTYLEILGLLRDFQLSSCT
jgi:hypothetical protein